MRTRLNIDERLIDEARRLTGVNDVNELIHRALEELISREASRALASLGSFMPKLGAISRRRPKSGGRTAG